jgi:hypothetical protein
MRQIVAIVDDIRGLTAWDVTSLLGAFLATIAPGLLIVYLFKPELVLHLDTLKLFVFSAALTFPVIAVNAFVVAVVGPFTGSIGSGAGTRKHVYFWQASWAFLTLYSALLIAYIFKLTVILFIGTVAVLDVLFAVIVLWVMRFLVRQHTNHE